MEVRTFDATEIEIRGDEDSPKIVGHAAVFNQEVIIGGKTYGYRETIAPGAFKKSIRSKSDDVVGLFNHDSNYVLGRQSAKTLELREDDTGMWYEIDPPDTQYAKDLKTSIKRKDIRGNSFSFEIVKDEWTDPEKEGEMRSRVIKEVRLYDVGPVTFPAYPQTDVSVRSILTGAGIDFDRLAQIIERGETDPEDRSVIENSIDILSKMIQEQEPTQGGESDSQVTNALRLRKLELLELEGGKLNEVTRASERKGEADQASPPVGGEG